MHMDVRGLVLRGVDYKETDRILTVLTGENGLMTVKARGCRRKNSPLAAPTQLFAYSQMTLFEYRDYYTLQEAAVQDQFLGLRTELEKLALASYFAEVAQTVAVEGEQNSQLLSLVLNSLYALDKLDKPLDLVRAAFDLRCMVIAGYAPLLDACAICGVAQPLEPQLHIQEGVLCCRDCRHEAGPGRTATLSPEMLQAARHIAYGDAKRLFSFSLPKEQLGYFADLAADYLATQLERRFQTLDYYLSVRL